MNENKIRNFISRIVEDVRENDLSDRNLIDKYTREFIGIGVESVQLNAVVMPVGLRESDVKNLGAEKFKDCSECPLSSQNGGHCSVGMPIGHDKDGYITMCM